MNAAKDGRQTPSDDVVIGLWFGPANEWSVKMRWRDGDRNGPSRIVIEPADPNHYPAGGISQTVLRDIKFGEAVEVVRKGRALLAETDRMSAQMPIVDWEAEGRRLLELSADGLTDGYLATLSWLYVAAAKEAKPLKRLAEVTGKSPAAIKSHLWQATRRDLLYRSPGRAGGVVTEKALGILSEGTDSPLSQV
jgi:hypothetical protein